MDSSNFGVQDIADHRHSEVHNLSPVEGDRTWTRALGKRDQSKMGPVTRAGLKTYREGIKKIDPRPRVGIRMSNMRDFDKL